MSVTHDFRGEDAGPDLVAPSAGELQRFRDGIKAHKAKQDEDRAARSMQVKLARWADPIPGTDDLEEYANES